MKSRVLKTSFTEPAGCTFLIGKIEIAHLTALSAPIAYVQFIIWSKVDRRIGRKPIPRGIQPSNSFPGGGRVRILQVQLLNIVVFGYIEKPAVGRESQTFSPGFLF